MVKCRALRKGTARYLYAPGSLTILLTIFQLRCTHKLSYCQQRHQLRFDFAYQLEPVLLF